MELTQEEKAKYVADCMVDYKFTIMCNWYQDNVESIFRTAAKAVVAQNPLLNDEGYRDLLYQYFLNNVEHTNIMFKKMPMLIR